MVRKILDFLNPTRRLPEPMRKYLRVPNRLFLGWLVLTVLVPAALLQMNAWGLVDLNPPPPASEAEPPAVEISPADRSDQAEFEDGAPPPIAGESIPAPDSGVSGESPASGAMAMAGAAMADGARIVVTGPQPFTLRRSGDLVQVEIPGRAAMSLAGAPGDFRLVDAAGTLVYRLKVKEGEKGKLFDGGGTYRLRVKCETEQGDESCKLYDPDGKRLQRVKIKGDSFNVYGVGEDRLYKGKLKDGTYVLRDEGKATLGSVTGVASLKEAALLSMPVDIPVRVLLWRYAGR